jgi:hypothetical protein
MRWRYAKWAWSGHSESGPEDKGWYEAEPRKVLVTNRTNGKQIVAAILESGPAPWTGTPQGESTPHPYWNGYVDGTPQGYNGRVAGFPPVAVAALGMQQWMHGGPGAGGSGDVLEYQWAEDQTITPGPITGGASDRNNNDNNSNDSSDSDSEDEEDPLAEIECPEGSSQDLSGDITQPNPSIQSDTPTACSGGPTEGTTELANYIMGRWQARNLGIYNCRSVVGGSSLSLHAEGRAFDAGLLVTTPEEKQKGDELFRWAIINAANIGAQEIIWNRKIWTPSSGLRDYSGSNPHTDHVHIGQNRAGASKQTAFYTSNAGR